MIENHLLSLLIFIPLIAGVVLLFIPETSSGLYKWITLGTLVVELILTLILLSGFDASQAGIGNESLQFVEKMDWINLSIGSTSAISIQYYLGVDGLSISMVLLSAIVLLIGVISSWNIKENLKGYFSLYLILTASVFGCFLALDFFLFFLFFEFMLLPMYFLIGLWGGVRREYASIKFYLYTLVGSIFILIVMIALSISVITPDPEIDIHSFDLMLMMDNANFIPDSVLSISSSDTLLGLSYRLWAFLFVLIGFAIKLPAVPIHTWLPDAHVEAPTPISVVLAGILLKIGGYGFYRIAYSIFPEGAYYFGWWIGLFGIIAIIYGALVAMAQSDLKRLIAYSSVSHMGFVMLGLAAITTQSISGSIFQMFSHGLISVALFLITGVIYDRTKDREISNYSGLAAAMPYFTVIVLITFFASLGLPGFSGFIAEFLVLAGAFDGAMSSEVIAIFMPIVGVLGLVLGAAYFLWTLQRMFFGKYWIKNEEWTLPDLTTREYIMFVPLVVMIFAFGIFPGLILDLSNETIMSFVEFVQEQGKQNMTLILENTK
ncbi:NADH-quinone oxidoreductase subunit M [Reichenbachiella sp. MALMAid0571]|uniref:complex I subunit 4 family protein n=1 Tax=Reichenbachiella sp. MALMAid0571 TaxID=3143939 RepID=UPI0032E04C3D